MKTNAPIIALLSATLLSFACGGAPESAGTQRRARTGHSRPEAAADARDRSGDEGDRRARTAPAGQPSADSVPRLRAAAAAGSRHRGVPVRRRASRGAQLRAVLLRLRAGRASRATTTASCGRAPPTATSSSGMSTASNARSASTSRPVRARCTRRVRRSPTSGPRSKGVRGILADDDADTEADGGRPFALSTWIDGPRRSRGCSRRSTRACTSGRSVPMTPPPWRPIPISS